MTVFHLYTVGIQFFEPHSIRSNSQQAYKHVAALQHRYPTGPIPVLLRMDMNSGHWSGKVLFDSLYESVLLTKLTTVEHRKID